MPAKASKATTPAKPQTQEVQTLPLQYEVRIHSLHPNGNCRASASVNLNGSFAIRGIKVMESEKGLFVSLPSYRAGNGEYKDICFPCTKQARQDFDAAVLNAYEQALMQNQSQGTAKQNTPDPSVQQEQAVQQIAM